MATKKCMKCGGSMKKYATGGATKNKLNKARGFAKPTTGGDNVSKNIFGVPNAGPTGPNRSGTYDYKKGGSVKKLKKAQSGAEVDLDAPPFKSRSSKIGVGLIGSGIAGMATKAIADKIKAKKAAKKASEEKKKSETTKAKFGATVNVQRGYPHKIRSAEAQGYTAVGKREPGRTKFPKLAKGGFPDLTGDGKVTKADVLKGRGVIKKKGGAVKKK